MSSLTYDIRLARARKLAITGETLTVDLTDGRTISVPLNWYPRLQYGSQAERDHWRLIGQGEGLHWPDLDEDISVENILLGKPSGESAESFKRWREQRDAERGNDSASQRFNDSPPEPRP